MDVIASEISQAEKRRETNGPEKRALGVFVPKEKTQNDSTALSPQSTKKRIHEKDIIIPIGPKKACLLHHENDGTAATSSLMIEESSPHRPLMQYLSQGKYVAAQLRLAIAKNGSILEILDLLGHLFETSRVETFALDLILAFWNLFPEVTEQSVLPMFSKFECWQQLLLLMKLSKKSKRKKRIYDGILAVFQSQWEIDIAIYERSCCISTEQEMDVDWHPEQQQQLQTQQKYQHHLQRLSSVAVWLPRERGKWDKELDFVRRISRMLYPDTKRQTAKAMYRKQVALFTEMHKLVVSQRSGETIEVATGVVPHQKRQQTLDDQEATAATAAEEEIQRKPLTCRRTLRDGQLPLFSFPTMIRLPGRRLLTTQTAIGACDYLTLPRSGRVDNYFLGDELLTSIGEQFLQKGTRHFTRQSDERILYIHQGELGHATPDQCDVIVSDRATTCHVMAFRSEFQNSSLTSLAHIDASFYDECVQSMLETHIAHHRSGNGSEQDEKKLENAPSPSVIDIQVHICGGFNDDRHSSQRITEWLMHLLAWLADEYQEEVTMTLATCVVSSMNDDGYTAPVGRGMGVDLRTGEAFLAKVDGEVCGPAQQIRNARIWSHGDGTLNVVHTATSNDFIVKPFLFKGCSRHDEFLRLPDEKMIKRTSTSPDVEEDDFCLAVRNTLRFMREIDCADVFGRGQDEALAFQRVGISNSWRRVR